MNRKDFFRKFGLIATAAIVAPTVVKALVEDKKEVSVDPYDQRHLGAQGIFPGEYIYKDGGLYPKTYEECQQDADWLLNFEMDRAWWAT